jgi:hypothetical protein
MPDYLEVGLSVFSDTMDDNHIQITKSLHMIDGITTVTCSLNTNTIDVSAEWKESEFDMKIKEVRNIANVKAVQITRKNRRVERGIIEKVKISDTVMAVRTKKYPITKKDVCILLIPIAFVVVSGLIMYVLSSSEGIFWGILGIMSTVALGVLLFLMQMSADRQTNEIIRKQNDRYIQSKKFFCNEIIRKLHEFKNTYTKILSYIQDFETKKSNPNFLKGLEDLVLLSNIKIEQNLIPTITEYLTLAIDKLEDIELGIQIRHYLDGLYGPIYRMEEARKQKDPSCGLEKTTTVEDKINIIEGKMQQIEELIVRMEREKPK